MNYLPFLDLSILVCMIEQQIDIRHKEPPNQRGSFCIQMLEEPYTCRRIHSVCKYQIDHQRRLRKST